MFSFIVDRRVRAYATAKMIEACPRDGLDNETMAKFGDRLSGVGEVERYALCGIYQPRASRSHDVPRAYRADDTASKPQLRVNLNDHKLRDGEGRSDAISSNELPQL